MSKVLSSRTCQQNELEIVKRFADLGFQIHPEAIEMLTHFDGNGKSAWHFDLDAIAESVIKSLDPSICVISPEQIADFINKNGVRAAEKKIVKQQTQTQTEVEVEAPTIIMSFPEHGKAADHKDFLPHFIDRYERLSGIIKKRVKCRQIRFLKTGKGGEDISVVGIVSAINKTVKGNLRVELEDPTGSLSVIMPHQEEIIPDEIIGVTGFLANEGYFIANGLIHPDVPRPASTSQSSLPSSASEQEKQRKKPVYAVFISDMHVGSNTFLEGAWDSFAQWLKEKAERISYLVVAGDIADGIGVYPGQEEDLLITDIEEQYKVAAGYFHDFPPHIHVVVAPGNHDAVRGAEPQPPLPENLRKLFPDNTRFVSNPAYIQIGGRRVLIYHGQSYDDLVNSVPRLSYAKPEDTMIEMMRRRHLAPIYGNAVSIVPTGHDYGVIDPVPDILHCGHTHTVGIAKYRNVLLINSGTWQAQTPYQKKRDITPVAGCATVVELGSMKVKVMDFGSRAGA
jgi:DNA polymerase II small subunit